MLSIFNSEVRLWCLPTICLHLGMAINCYLPSFWLLFLCSGLGWLDKQPKNRNGGEWREWKLHFSLLVWISAAWYLRTAFSKLSGFRPSDWSGLRMLRWLELLCFSDLFFLKCLGPTSCFKANIRYFWKLVRNFNGCQGKSQCHLSLKKFWLPVFHLRLSYPAAWHWMKQLWSKTAWRQVGTF